MRGTDDCGTLLVALTSSSRSNTPRIITHLALSPTETILPIVVSRTNTLLISLMRSKLPGLRRTHFAVSEGANGQACNTQGRSQLRRKAEGSAARIYKCREKAGSWPSRILHSEVNTATIYVDNDTLAHTIYYQTHRMRRFFEASPQVLMVDATHNTNDARYKLFSFMIHDVFGHRWR
ncbi:hypothetical protein PI124_g12862 [Phytophthora idaei]|nr:hypothetical protein PI125_g12384 [Phytophthora idaei]KAG3150612.1 hypothetical protein PI126_g11401 [Phytophthora idaei]KAG3242277.1 hypothetical protein PI124_g12862 [Phytophthora idaei]